LALAAKAVITKALLNLIFIKKKKKKERKKNKLFL
jgi:hypothetical protein